MKQKLHNTSRSSCYKTKRFVKKHFIKKFTKLTFVSNFTVNVTINCQLHCLLLLLAKLSCSTHSYQNNFIRSCICINLIRRENSMTAFTTQLVLCEFSQISSEHRLWKLHSWTRNIWNNSKFELLRFFMYLK